MNNPVQDAILNACRSFMKPLVRLLLKSGVGYREFAEISKTVFVEVASDDYGIRGRKTNMSRVAVMTGLTRKEVRKIRNAIEAGLTSPVTRTRRPESVLAVWHGDPEYLDKHMSPKRIPFEGAGANFRDLVARVGGDIPPRAMLNELLRAGSIVPEGNKFRAVSRSYVPESNDPAAVQLAGEAISDLVATVHHNLSCRAPEERFLERRVYSDRLPSSQRMRFRKLARDKGELLLHDLNAWLSDREKLGWRDKTPEVAGELPTIGVGVYFFDNAAGDSPAFPTET